ncbi:ABC transporter ATP-binding protein [Halobacillus sp. B23F22_1]|uniref:ABC transporter ATP-binding protein n=1 Tax=Halobacillus sp. B23F22_1 TaxID=3459514 RepID=UPI00373F875D
MIELSDVDKSIHSAGQYHNILSDVNLRIERGDFISIIGPSGSGKSTLMNILGCLDRPSSGTYKMDGKDVTQLTDTELSKERNENIGFVFQSFHLLNNISASENVQLPLVYAGVPRKERKARAREALVKVGLEERLTYLPNQLSGGQKQRVAIARALVHHPKIIFADEPTGSLDSQSSALVMDTFKLLNNEGITIVIITHDPEIAGHSTKVMSVKDGMLA